MLTIDIEQVGAILRAVAAAEAMPRWRNLSARDIVEKDGPDDLVTVADKAVEVALSRELVRLLPGSRIVGEEAVHADPAGLDVFRSGDPVWVIDPIDGTSGFAKGSPEFAVMVALVEGGSLEAGWILAPVTGDLVCGRRGGGVWRSDGGELRRLPKPSRPDGIAQMRGITGRRKMPPERQRHIDAVASRFLSIEPAICAGIQYPQLIAGEAHFALFMKSEPWDHLPGLALAAEQGMYYARHDGSPYRPGDNTGGLLVAPDRAAFDEIHALMIA